MTPVRVPEAENRERDGATLDTRGAGARTFGVVRALPLADQAYEQLRRAIVTLEIPPGERIVIEQLATFLHVSRTPVREALPRLVGDGLLEALPNGVLRVTPITQVYVRETHQTRAGLEGSAAFLATPRIPDSVLSELEQRFRSIEPEIDRGDFAGHFEADAMFHETILHHCGNHYLVRVLGGLHNHVHRIRNFSQTRPGAHVLASHGEHLEVLLALRARDARRAKDSIEAHVLAAGERLASLVATE